MVLQRLARRPLRCARCPHLAAVALQLARGESSAVNPGTLRLPFVLLTLPVLAVTAAAAVLFETISLLRAGVGNIT